MLQSGEPSRLPQILVTSAEREQTHALLKEACLDGRLTIDEFSQRFDLVERVRTRDQLALVTADLSDVALHPVVSRPAPSTTLAVMSSTERGGSHWRVPENNRAIAVMGECKLDLREATITSPVTTIRSRLLMGALVIWVPEGVAVELEVFTLMGEAKSRVVGPPAKPGAPVVRVTGFAIMGSVEVRSRR
jgi:hypothetical protein